MVYCLKVFCFLSFTSLVSFTGFSTEEKPGKECAASAGGLCVSGLFIVMRKLDAFSSPNVGLFCITVSGGRRKEATLELPATLCSHEMKSFPPRIRARALSVGPE